MKEGEGVEEGGRGKGGREVRRSLREGDGFLKLAACDALCRVLRISLSHGFVTPTFEIAKHDWIRPFQNHMRIQLRNLRRRIEHVLLYVECRDASIIHGHQQLSQNNLLPRPNHECF